MTGFFPIPDGPVDDRALLFLLFSVGSGMDEQYRRLKYVYTYSFSRSILFFSDFHY